MGVCMGLRVWGLGVYGLGFGVWGLGLGVWGLGFGGLRLYLQVKPHTRNLDVFPSSRPLRWGGGGGGHGVETLTPKT